MVAETEEVPFEATEVSCTDMPNTFEEDLSSIFNDFKDRVSCDTSEQLQAGIQKFCSCHEQMCDKRFSTNRIASTFNRFGWVFAGNTTNLQGGILCRGGIAVQATAAGRCCKTLSRGKSKAPAGRPLKLK